MTRRSFIQAGLLSAGATQFGWAHAEPGVSPTEVLLGNTAILTGPLGVQIRVILSGATLAFAAANEQGGVSGRQIKLISLDDELNPQKAIANYKQLLNEYRVFAFFGCGGSATTAAAANLLQQSGAPSVGGYGVSDSVREMVRSAYFVRAKTGREAQALAEHLVTIGVTKIAIAFLDNPGGVEAAKRLEAAMAVRQLSPSTKVIVNGDGSTAALAGRALAENQPQVVLMYLAGTVAGEVMKATFEAGGKPSFYGMSVVPGELTAKVVDLKSRSLAISQVMPYPWNEADPTTREYRRLAQRAGIPVGYATFEGYINALVLIAGLKRCGRDLTRASLQAAMRSLKFRLAGMEIDFTTGSGTGADFVEMVRVTGDGHFIR